MKHNDSNTIASEMDRVLNSEENKEMFSASSMLEKLAFKKVSEEDAVSEVEQELNSQGLRKEAQATPFFANSVCKKCNKAKPESTGACKCACASAADCAKGCPCGCKGGEYDPAKPSPWKESSVQHSLQQLLIVSEDLDNLGFSKLAAMSLIVANKLVVEAKAKKSDKKKSDKSKSKKMDMKERMKKMREMAGKNKDKAKKDDKKSSKKSSEDKK